LGRSVGFFEVIGENVYEVVVVGLVLEDGAAFNALVVDMIVVVFDEKGFADRHSNKISNAK